MIPRMMFSAYTSHRIMILLMMFWAHFQPSSVESYDDVMCAQNINSRIRIILCNDYPLI